LDWANTGISGLLSIPLRRAPQAVFIHYSQFSAGSDIINKSGTRLNL
jgi:hypothetical protein